jgi:hypothetical protein
MMDARLCSGSLSAPAGHPDVAESDAPKWPAVHDCCRQMAHDKVVSAPQPHSSHCGAVASVLVKQGPCVCPGVHAMSNSRPDTSSEVFLDLSRTQPDRKGLSAGEYAVLCLGEGTQGSWEVIHEGEAMRDHRTDERGRTKAVDNVATTAPGDRFCHHRDEVVPRPSRVDDARQFPTTHAEFTVRRWE